MQRSARLFHACATGILMFLAGIIPLVYFPWTLDPLEINKQTVLTVGMIVAGLCWFGAALVERRMVFRWDWLFVAVAGFVLTAAFSAFFSDAPYLSLIGHSEQEYTSVLTAGLFGLFFFLGAQYFADSVVYRKVIAWMLVGSGIVALVTLPAFFGHPLVGTNLIGTPTPWAMYLVIMTLLGLAVWIASGPGVRRILPEGVLGVMAWCGFVVTAVTTLCAALAIDATALWFALIVGTGTLFIFAFIRAAVFSNPSRFIAPMLFFVLSCMFLFVPTPFGSPFIAEVSPSHAASWRIATATLHEEGFLLGSGPGTYTFDYTAHRAVGINSSTEFWDVRFDRASSHVLTLLATHGVLGTALYLLIVLGLFSVALSRLLVERDHEAWIMLLVPFVAWSGLAAAQFVLPLNMTLQTCFWILSAGLASQAVRRIVDVTSTKSPQAGLFAAFAFVLAAVLLIATMFVSVSRYRAEMVFARAIAADQHEAPLEEVIVDLDTAALRNRWNDVYYRNLGQALLLKTAEYLQDAEADPAQVQGLIGASINAARRATELSPKNVVNWLLLGDIYREVSPMIGDADAFAISSYERAIALAPQNPKYYVSLARAYVTQADLAQRFVESDDAVTAENAIALRTTALEGALTALTTAVTLKPDYAPAQYYLALVYERQEMLADAIVSMEKLRIASPHDIGVSLQLGLLYLRQGKNELAKQELLRALDIEPNYSNARWYLASLYQQEGDFTAAIEQIEAVKKLNPDNASVQQRLEQLQQGLAESQLPDPLEETPETPITEETDETSP